jgi:hypothetical protein
MKLPFFGSRKMAVELGVGRHHTRRLMHILGIEAHYPKPHLSRPAPAHQIQPYLSNTLETGSGVEALDTAFRFGQPEIWNFGQGSRFTSVDFLASLKKRDISKDGRGRGLDKSSSNSCDGARSTN